LERPYVDASIAEEQFERFVEANELNIEDEAAYENAYEAFVEWQASELEPDFDDEYDPDSWLDDDYEYDYDEEVL
jgi:hypothetical protein